MNVYAEYGHKVIATDLNAGFESDKENAHKYLELDKIYTVDWTEVGRTLTEVKLVEIPESSFNSLHFEDYEGD